MGDQIIIAVLILVGVMAVGILVKRAGRKGCCGSAGDYRARKKRLNHVIGTKTFQVEGMHCEKCSNRVMETVNDIPDAAGTVDLKNGILTVSYAREIPDEQITAKLERLGYRAIRLEEGNRQG